MKKRIFNCMGLLLMFVLCAGLFACEDAKVEKDLWASAVYTEDTEFGTGEKTVMVEVVAGEKSVTFTIHSDKEFLGEALVEHDLIEGERGAYGIYVKKVNGILADYDKNQAYWGFNKDGEGMMTGVDGAEFKDGEHYELVYTK